MSEHKTVRRWVIAKRVDDGYELVMSRSGNKPFASKRDAEQYLAAMLRVNRREDLEALYGPLDNLEAREWDCWEGSGDPVGVYSDLRSSSNP